jgi:hypothetical protein
MTTQDIAWEVRNAAGSVIASGTRQVPIIYKKLTRFEFWNLLTFDEKVLVLAAVAASPLMAVWWRDYEAASEFLRDHPSTAEGLDVLVYEECLTPQRAAAILADWPTV